MWTHRTFNIIMHLIRWSHSVYARNFFVIDVLYKFLYCIFSFYVYIHIRLCWVFIQIVFIFIWCVLCVISYMHNLFATSVWHESLLPEILSQTRQSQVIAPCGARLKAYRSSHSHDRSVFKNSYTIKYNHTSYYKVKLSGVYLVRCYRINIYRLLYRVYIKTDGFLAFSKFWNLAIQVHNSFWLIGYISSFQKRLRYVLLEKNIINIFF